MSPNKDGGQRLWDLSLLRAPALPILESSQASRGDLCVARHRALAYLGAAEV